MKKNNHNFEKEIEKKYHQRDKRKNSKMRVSGAGVKKLGKLIKSK